MQEKSVDKNFFLDKALYIVSMPIGNMMDITLRALDVLKKCDFVICEDSRVSSRLLSFFKINKPFIIYNDHSDQTTRNKIANLITEEGKSLCLISDAGTPLISDPGYKLVDFLIENNIEVKSVPGPCSVIASLSISGIESDKFLFAGFLPNTKSQKEKFLHDLVDYNSTIILFESAKRLTASLEIILKVFGNRKVAIAREITKLYEEVRRDNLENLVKYYQSSNLKGEIVILIAKSQKKDSNQELSHKDIDDELRKALENMSPKDAVNLIAENYDINKKVIYQKMLNLKK